MPPAFLYRVLHHQFLDERNVPSLELFRSRSMSSRKMIAVEIVLQEQRLKMCQSVFVPKESPHLIFMICAAAVKLMRFQLLKLSDELLVDGEVLNAVGSW